MAEYHSTCGHVAENVLSSLRVTLLTLVNVSCIFGEEIIVPESAYVFIYSLSGHSLLNEEHNIKWKNNQKRNKSVMRHLGMFLWLRAKGILGWSRLGRRTFQKELRFCGTEMEMSNPKIRI